MFSFLGHCSHPTVIFLWSTERGCLGNFAFATIIFICDKYWVLIFPKENQLFGQFQYLHLANLDKHDYYADALFKLMLIFQPFRFERLIFKLTVFTIISESHGAWRDSRILANLPQGWRLFSGSKRLYQGFFKSAQVVPSHLSGSLIKNVFCKRIVDWNQKCNASRNKKDTFRFLY